MTFPHVHRDLVIVCDIAWLLNFFAERRQHATRSVEAGIPLLRAHRYTQVKLSFRTNVRNLYWL